MTNLKKCFITGEIYDPETEGWNLDREELSSQVQNALLAGGYESVNVGVWEDLVGAGVIPAGCPEEVSIKGIEITSLLVDRFCDWITESSQKRKNGNHKYSGVFKAISRGAHAWAINPSDLWKISQKYKIRSLNQHLLDIRCVSEVLLKERLKFKQEIAYGFTLSRAFPLNTSWFGVILGLLLIGDNLFKIEKIEAAIKDAAIVAASTTISGLVFSSINEAFDYIDRFEKAIDENDDTWVLLSEPNGSSGRCTFHPVLKAVAEEKLAERLAEETEEVVLEERPPITEAVTPKQDSFFGWLLAKIGFAAA